MTDNYLDADDQSKWGVWFTTTNQWPAHDHHTLKSGDTLWSDLDDAVENAQGCKGLVLKIAVPLADVQVIPMRNDHDYRQSPQYHDLEAQIEQLEKENKALREQLDLSPPRQDLKTCCGAPMNGPHATHCELPPALGTERT